VRELEEEQRMWCKAVTICGYATMDYAVRLPHAVVGSGTYSVEAILPRDWPRAGGAALYAARRIAAAGHRATALVVIGDDSNGVAYRRACSSAGVAIAPLASAPNVRTPWCLLAYHDDGSYTCLLDRGNADGLAIDAAAVTSVARTDLVCIAAGDPAVTSALLDHVDAGTPVAWIVKNDAACFPPSLARRLIGRANFIFCNESERALVAAEPTVPRPAGQAIIQTRGSRSVLIELDGACEEIAVRALAVRDATGAGDTLAGEVLAQVLRGAPLDHAVNDGAAAASELLAARHAE
jgi:ribokinase